MSFAAAAVLATPFVNSFVRPEEIMLKQVLDIFH